MSTRYDLCIPAGKKRDGGNYWHKIGVMFPAEKGGFTIKLNSLPIPNEKGEVWVSAFEPRDDNRQDQSASAGGGSGGPAGGLDDAIPFSPSVL